MIDRAASAGERIVVTRHGEPMAAVVPLDDLELVEEVERRLARRAERAGADGVPRRHPEPRTATRSEQMRIWAAEE